MPSEGESLRHAGQIAQYRLDLVWRKYRHHLGQDSQYLPGHVLGVLECLLGGLLLGVVVLVELGVIAVAILVSIAKNWAGFPSAF